MTGMGGNCLNQIKKAARQSKGRVRSIGGAAKGSQIIAFFDRLSQKIYRKLENGFFGGIFTAYDRENRALENSGAASLVRRLNPEGRLLGPMKHRIAEALENSWILGGIRKHLTHMLYSAMRVYGLFLFSFALYASLIYLFKSFWGYDPDTFKLDFGLIVTIVLMLIASVAMLASRRTLAQALLEGSLSRFLLLDVVGIRRESLEQPVGSEGRFNVAFIMGLLFGLASYFVSPIWLLAGIGLLIAACLVLISPEFGVLAIVILLPFAPTMALVGAVLYTALAMFLKLICGKRTLRMDLMDQTVFLFLLLMIGGGVAAASRGSLKPMMVYVAFMLAYFLVVNLIRSMEWLMRCLVGAAGSCTVVALYGLYQNFFGVVEQTWQDSDMFSTIKGRVVSTFENPNVLAEYLIMVLPLLLAMFLLNRNPKVCFALALCIAVNGGCLIFTWSRGAWLGFLIGTVIFLLMTSRHTLTAMLFALLGVPFLPFVLPDSITQRFMSIGNLGDSSTSYRVNIWKGVIDMLQDYWPTGIGIGYDSFKLVYPGYALSAIEKAPHAHNLFLQILVEIGIVGLIVFLAAMFFYVQGSLTLHVKERRSERLLSAAVFCGILAVLAQGMTDYIWYNYRVFLMFWLMLGLGAAIRKNLNATAVEYEL